MRSYLLKTLGVLLLSMAFVTSMGGTAKACDRTEIQLDSLINGPLGTTIQLTVHMGAGITGTSAGGDGATRTFGFAFFGSATLADVKHPDSLVSDTTNAVYFPLELTGAFGSVYTIAYAYSGVDFTCVTTTAACGNKHTNTLITRFTTNELPDSLRLLGIEGAGNPFAGCYPDADMLIDFTGLPVVWADFTARPASYGVDLEWATAVETNNDHFLIQRSADGNNFETLVKRRAVGNSSNLSGYDYTDPSPLSGTNFYRIVQVDVDGKQTNSRIQQVEYVAPIGMSWTQIGPNPATDFISLGYYLEHQETISLKLIDLQGRVVMQKEISGLNGINNVSLDLGAVAKGYYNLLLQNSNGILQKKVLKL
ncbi:MAG TPA: T9SS type A sorting domain-containing protein [Bacteroidetes bacterium]|nr:T9SS type A sorting domain-containing protein [Bacteroidota bacterium]